MYTAVMRDSSFRAEFLRELFPEVIFIKRFTRLQADYILVSERKTQQINTVKKQRAL